MKTIKKTKLLKSGAGFASARAERDGFTLIELLVVIAIISLLASVVLVALNGARQKARVAKVNADLQQIYKGIELSRDTNNKTLPQITGSFWSVGSGGCLGYDFADRRNLPASDFCAQYTNSQFQKLGFAKAPTDPWGSLYTLDENEGEGGGCFGQDIVMSVGPDGIYGNGDEYTVYVPYFQCK